MNNVKRWVVLNISLVVIVVLLFLNLFDVETPSFGKAWSFFDTEDPLCVVEWKRNHTLWNDLDRCCLEARKQLDCRSEELFLDGHNLKKVCATGEGDVLRYWFNSKGYYYCTDQVFWK